MTIPNVTVRWCTKRTQCKHCPKPIIQGQGMVVVFLWNKGSEKRTWNYTMYYHLDCWLAQAKDYLSRNPYVPHIRGRRQNVINGIELSQENATKRKKLVKRFHRLYQNRLDLPPFPDNILVESRLTKQMTEVMMEMVGLGGVPKSWIEKL